MTDLVSMVEHSSAGPAVSSDHLDRLVCRIAAGDRPAFRCLYAFLAVRVWRTAARALPHPGHAIAITRSTFLEVWYTAGAAAHYDARDWIEAITAFRVDERRRVFGDHDHDREDLVISTAGLRQRATDLVDQDDRIHRELASVLGTGWATIRVAPAMFVRVEDLDDAVNAIAATAALEPRHPGRHSTGPGVLIRRTSSRQRRRPGNSSGETLADA